MSMLSACRKQSAFRMRLPRPRLRDQRSIAEFELTIAFLHLVDLEAQSIAVERDSGPVGLPHVECDVCRIVVGYHRFF